MTQQVKDFQNATAKRILHIFKDLKQRRVLLADEVGLGKTFVAKQVINLVREWHKEEKDDFFKVVYICSNANIAKQNIEKLGVSNQMKISESRLSMQHLFIKLAEQQIVKQQACGEMPESIFPLTPSTSFRFYSARGTANERALMCNILCGLPQIEPLQEQVSNFLSCEVKNWHELRDRYNRTIKECGEAYLKDMHQKLQANLTDDLISQMVLYAQNGAEERQKTALINALRRLFAEISIDMLDPDLVIMDEFQRFSSLLVKGDDEQSMLANKFFDNERTNTKVLLLSATPYKPYSTLEDLNTDGIDEHYKDFIDVMQFLFANKERMDQFKQTWQSYSTALKKTEVVNLTPLLAAKQCAEEELYGVMCRTERFNSGTINDSNVCDVSVQPQDILAYAQCKQLVEQLANANGNKKMASVPMEYVKSSPYLLSFMDRYDLKKHIVDGLRQQDEKLVYKKKALLLNKKAILNHKHVDAGNGKLKFLHDLVFGQRHENNTQLLLWIPASNPYYKAGGIFESSHAQSFSKVILFSAWEMVPRMISVMMSYYAERYTFGELKNRKTADLRDASAKKSRYGESRLRADGILEYPCHTLAEMFKPAEFYGERLETIRKAIKQKLSERLEQCDFIRQLPRKARGNAKMIINIMKLLDGKELEETEDLYVPSNALDVMTNVAIASPAVCAFRLSGNEDDAKLAAKALVSVFNKPESAAIIDLIYNKKNKDDYYESVLDYCARGNLQAVLDEYAHMLETQTLGTPINKAIIDTSSLKIDTTHTLGKEGKRLPMRCHFAIPFVDKTVTDKSIARTENILDAFNSPFRPFILSTTSIGQEGLDFHWFARKVVHWNLPSNPVDLEQREGRVNRFKCLAIRKNVAKLFGGDKYHSWDELFNLAYAELKGNHSEMVPFWCLPIEELAEEQKALMVYIERIVPMFPLSRDKYRYAQLINVLGLYRMTLGQPRQEELLSLLKGMHLSDEKLKELTIDLCPYNKKDAG